MSPEILFEDHKDVLLSFALRKQEAYTEMLAWIDAKHLQGYTKKDIYLVFLELHEFIQVDIRTKGDHEVYNALSDFMDGFSVWGKKFRILPDEPDI